MDNHIRHGAGAARPYLHGPVGLLQFVVDVLGAREIERHQLGPQSFHVEFQVGDSALVIEAGELPSEVEPWTNSVYVYVPDVDAAFAKAVELGAEEIASPADKPYQERQAGFRDAGGNTWWIATYRPDHDGTADE
ncbi:MAG: VOC family protein [Gammaproteobacteria bacterium]|nr:VOC family protein [Gammaproteobacteria bacterium]